MKPGFVVPVREKIAFGLGDFAYNVAYLAIGLYFSVFLVKVAGLPASFAAIIILVGRLYVAVIDYFIGILSDRTKSKYGRRRIYILIFSVPLGILFVTLWIVPFDSDTALLIYYLIAYIVFNTIYALSNIPYNSLQAELSQNYDERTSISGYRIALTFLGNLVAAAGVTLIIDVAYSGESEYIKSFPIMGIIFGAVMIVSLLITFVGTKERVHVESVTHEGIFKTLASVFKIREFRLVLGMFIFNMSALDIIQTFFFYFINDVIKIEGELSYIIMGLPFITAVAAAPLWVYLGEKMGKRHAYILGAIFGCSALSVCLFAPVGNFWFLLIFAGLAGMGMSAAQVLPWSIVPDVIEIDELRNGTRREGAFYGATLLITAFLSSITISSSLAFLQFFGYQATENNIPVEQPDSALNYIRIAMGVLPSVYLIISLIFAKILPITKESFDEVKRVIEEKRQKALAENQTK